MGFKFNPFTGNFDLSGGGGVAIGDAIGSGTSGSILFIDSSGNLAQANANLSYRTDSSPNFLLTAANASHVPLSIKGAVSQSGLMLDVQNSGSTTVFSIDVNGKLTTNNTTTATSMQMSRTQSTRVANALNFVATDTYSWTGAGTNIRQFSLSSTDSRTVNSGVSDNFIGMRMAPTRNGVAVISIAASNLTGIQFVANDIGTYNFAGDVAVANTGISAQVQGEPIVDVGAANTLTYTMIGVESVIGNTSNPTITSGSLIANTYGFHARGTGHTGGTHTGYAFYNALTGFDTLWSFYNNTAANNFLGNDNSKTYFGTGQDASIYYDGTNLVVNPKDVGSGLLDVQGTIQSSTIQGSSSSGGTLTLQSTSHATKGQTSLANILYVDEVNGRIGVGANDPSFLFNVVGNTKLEGITTLSVYGVGANCRWETANGTRSAPTQVTTSRTIGTFTPRAMDDTGTYRNCGVLQFDTESAITSTSSPGMFILSLTPSGSVTVSEVFRVTSAKNFLHGTSTTPSGATVNFVLGGGTSSPVLGAATADMVSLGAIDNGAGNREFQVQPEAGGKLAWGNDHLRRVRSSTQDVDQFTTTLNTTSATVGTLATIAIAADYTYIIDAVVVARRTGGSSGTADDGASYERRATYTTKTGTVTLMGSVQTIGTDAEDQAGWDVTLDISSTNVRVRVTGAANNNITWSGDITVRRVNS